MSLPGPAIPLVVARSLAEGRRVAVPPVAGVGDSAAATAFLTRVLTRHPML